MVKLLHDSGVPIVAGTDGIAGLTFHRELELYVQAGLSTGDALQISSLGAARLMKRDKTSGSIDVGKDADMILIDGDPLAHIEDVRKVVRVFRSGTWYDAAALYDTVGVKPLSSPRLTKITPTRRE
jgi:imidazolonepropionase-like amidohydrolase